MSTTFIPNDIAFIHPHPLSIHPFILSIPDTYFTSLDELDHGVGSLKEEDSLNHGLPVKFAAGGARRSLIAD